MASTTSKRTNRHLQEMMLIFDFTAEDLEQNKAGTLTERQSQVMKSNGVRDIAVVWGIALFIGIPTIGAFFWMIFPELDDRVPIGIHLLIWGVMVGLPLAFAGYAGWATYRHFSTRDDVDVITIEGIVQTQQTRIRREVFCDMHINGQKFPISEDMYALIRSGQRYRVLYIDSSKNLVAMEPIE